LRAETARARHLGFREGEAPAEPPGTFAARREPRPPEWQGFTTYFDRYPDDKLTVIVLCNLSPPFDNPGEIAAAVAAEYVPDLAGKRKE